MFAVKKPENMLLRDIAVYTGDDGRPHLIYKDISGHIHNLTSDETRIEKIQELIAAIRTSI